MAVVPPEIKTTPIDQINGPPCHQGGLFSARAIVLIDHL